jgi:hypothetical protein
VKRLIHLICSTEAYGLSSQRGKYNDADNPAAGEVPLFSHMYLKSMQAEQMYDSLIVASNAHQVRPGRLGCSGRAATNAGCSSSWWRLKMTKMMSRQRSTARSTGADDDEQ